MNRRTMNRPTMNRPTMWAVLPAAGGLVAAALLLVAFPGYRVFVAAAPALWAGGAGITATAALLAADGMRRRARARQDERVRQANVAAEQSRRRFVQRLDHELKNPLTALLAALSGPDDEPGSVLGDPRQALAHRQADRIRRLLTDLRRVADVETAELDRTPVDTAALLREAVDAAVADSGTSRRVDVDVPSAPWPLPVVAGDADLLTVAVYNVVANAIKYTSDGDIVEVRARETGEPVPSILIEVADTGPGIAEDEQQTVWEELARGRAGATVPGSGVGLALVKVIIQRHGGSVALRSRLGHGTSIYLQLPT